MACQHFGLQLECLMTLFGTIQTIKMFLCTSFGVSEQFYTRTSVLLFQGRVQGNEATPPLWLTLSIMIVRYLYASKWVSVRKTVMSQSAYSIAGSLYVDDTYLIAMNKGDEPEDTIVARAQLLVYHW